MKKFEIPQEFEWPNETLQRGPQGHYHAMYSSWWDRIVTDPRLMLVPLDDHLVHRGDGVFEAMKFVGGRVFLLKEHLDRLFSSANHIGVILPFTRERLTQLIEQTIEAAQVSSAVVRVFCSRGPGSFSVNPYDSVGPQLYIVVESLRLVSEALRTNGARVGISALAPKDSRFAQIKSCNYLLNVLMKKEAVERGLDFVVGITEEGFLTEGATENIGLISQEGKLLVPEFDRVLKGTTLIRVMQLAEKLVAKGELREIKTARLKRQDFVEAREVFMAGTTIDVLAVKEFDGHIIHRGHSGSVVPQLESILRSDFGH